MELSREEMEALCWALDNYLPALRYGEARIKRERDRHDVVTREELLTALRERLRQHLMAEAALTS
jgi:hypothetical protein